MATIPQWLLGRHLVAITITPQTITAAGVLGDGTASALVAVADSVSLSLVPAHEEINPVNSVRANNVITHDDGSVQVGIIEVHDGSDPDPLEALVVAGDVFKVVFTKGTKSGSVKTWTGYFTRGNCSFGIQGRGKQIASLELLQVDAGVNTMVRS